MDENFFFNFHEKFAEMSENLKKNCVFSRIKIRTIRTIWKQIRTIRTILGLKKDQSVQSVHFGHPAMRSASSSSVSILSDLPGHKLLDLLGWPAQPSAYLELHLSTKLWPLPPSEPVIIKKKMLSNFQKTFSKLKCPMAFPQQIFSVLNTNLQSFRYYKYR